MRFLSLRARGHFPADGKPFPTDGRRGIIPDFERSRMAGVLDVDLRPGCADVVQSRLRVYAGAAGGPARSDPAATAVSFVLWRRSRPGRAGPRSWSGCQVIGRGWRESDVELGNSSICFASGRAGLVA